MRSILCIVAALTTSIATAGLIGIGLDWRKNIYVQESWHNGAPSYTIANLSKENATITLADQKGNNLPAGPWVVGPNSSVTIDVRNLIGQGLVRWKLADGTVLGLLHSPEKQNPPKDTIASYDGLNGSGGRLSTIWIEQKTPSVKAGEEFAVTLKIPTGAGKVKWTKKSEAIGGIKQLPPSEIKCDSLTIKATKDSFEFDTANPSKQQPLHDVTLRFQVPADAPAMVMISGWAANNKGGGHGITRGFAVTPAK